MPADLTYDHFWMAVSVLVAIGAATASVFVAFRNTGIWQRTAASVVMGLAISGMHFAAMRAATFTSHQLDKAQAQAHADLDQTALALAVAGVTFLILFLAILAAIFDRRFAELVSREADALRASEERFRTLYKKTPLPLHTLTPRGIVEHVSDAWLDLLGYTRDEVVGRHISEFLTPESVQRHRDLWPKFLAEGTMWEVEYQALTKRGQVLDVLASGRVELDDEGRP
jgi:PAS domain S-box-containing protein